MSKVVYGRKPPPVARLGDWLKELRMKRDLPLREVAEAAEMDLAHLQKIEQGQRMPTEEQAAALAKFFRVRAADMQARWIAEKFRRDFAEHPAAADAITILAEEAGVYRAAKR